MNSKVIILAGVGAAICFGRALWLAGEIAREKRRAKMKP
jgi:hypothetical protein